MSIDGLYTKIIVHRVGVGAAPFTWKVVGANLGIPLFVSPDRFRSMEAAYNAGQKRLGDFMPRQPSNRGKRGKAAAWEPSAVAIDWHADEPDEIEMHGYPGDDGAPSQDSQPETAMTDDQRA